MSASPASTQSSGSFVSPPPTPPEVMVPDDSPPAPRRQRRSPSRLFAHFRRLDAFKSPARLKREADAQRWEAAVTAEVAKGGRSPHHDVVNHLLDDP